MAVKWWSEFKFLPTRILFFPTHDLSHHPRDPFVILHRACHQIVHYQAWVFLPVTYYCLRCWYRPVPPSDGATNTWSPLGLELVYKHPIL